MHRYTSLAAALAFACLALMSRPAHGVPRVDKPPTTPIERFKKHLEDRGFDYTSHADAAMRQKHADLPNLLNHFLLYEVQSAQGTRLLGVSAVKYIELVRTQERRKDQTDFLMEFPELDLADVTSATVGTRNPNRPYPEAQQKSTHVSHQLTLRFAKPFKARVRSMGKTQEARVSELALGFQTREDAEMAQELLKAVQQKAPTPTSGQGLPTGANAELHDMSTLVLCSDFFAKLPLARSPETAMEIIGQWSDSDASEDMIGFIDMYFEIKGKPYAGMAGGLLNAWKLANLSPSRLDTALRKLASGDKDKIATIPAKDLLDVIAYVRAFVTKTGKDFAGQLLNARFALEPVARANKDLWPTGFCGLVYSAVFN